MNETDSDHHPTLSFTHSPYDFKYLLKPKHILQSVTVSGVHVCVFVLNLRAHTYAYIIMLGKLRAFISLSNMLLNYAPKKKKKFVAHPFWCVGISLGVDLPKEFSFPSVMPPSPRLFFLSFDDTVRSSNSEQIFVWRSSESKKKLLSENEARWFCCVYVFCWLCYNI